MLFLFSTAGQSRLSKVVKPGMLCVFDFDGTLTPIVPYPDQARLSLPMKKRLRELSQLTPVAVITGRSLDDIRPRLEFEPAYIVGNHGLEGLPGWESRRETYETLCLQWEAVLQQALRDHSRYEPGILIENKRYSLSVHYRLTRDHEKVEKQLQDLFRAQTPQARIIAGKRVFSLVPPEAANKGEALERLIGITGAHAALYVGDDVTDEDVFELSREDILSIRIGISANSAAKFFLAHTGEMVQLIDDLIHRLKLLRRNEKNASPICA